MQSVESKDLKKLNEKFNKLIKELPEMKRTFHDTLGDMAKKEVDRQICQQLNGSVTRIQDWQEKHVGTGGGYAAVRAASTPSGKNGAGAITNYLEHGHKIRKPAVGSKRYRAKIHIQFVSGFAIYANTKIALQREIKDEADKLLNTIASKL